MKMTLPNKLTILRMLLVPVFMALLLLGYRYWALAVFIIASVTDFLDGRIARKYNLVSTFGKFADPLADKLLVISAMVIFVEWGQMPSWVAMIVIARELAITSLRIIAAANGVIMAAEWSGKIKTACTMIGLCIMMTPLKDKVIGGVTLNTIIVVIILVTTVVSGIEYFVKNGNVLKKEIK